MVENPRDLWPCLGAAGLEVFAITADQRYLLGEAIFEQTHFPITLRRFFSDRPSETTDEIALLKQLLRTDRAGPGNRVWVLYGAAGSGKSELMKWLQVMMARQQPDGAEVSVRVSRTELDVLSVAERFHHLLTQSYFDEKTHRRWEQARRKPRTLAKLLLLTALERCLEDDEQINALYYRLLDWIQPHIARSFALAGDDANELAQAELLTREDLDQLKAETALPVPLDYEQFRHHLLAALRDRLLEGISLPETLRLISEDVTRRQGLRPVLLIDDLVQSVNLFATDLLDYFITLDGGNWDVVVGLTPASLESSARGRELLDRITYLDTIDDRVEKLWLSDMQGHDSYFLTEDNCHDFAGRYFSAYRALNGWACEGCPHQVRCAGLDGDGMEPLLTPLNRAVLRRVFHDLPEGKGKARHLLRRLRTILTAVGEGENPLDVLARYAQLDTAVEGDDRELTRVAELYGPSVTGEDKVTLPSNLLRALGLSARSVTLRAEPLTQKSRMSAQTSLDGPAWIPDADKITVKAWLEGDASGINRQSLLPLRRGLARWLRTVYPVDVLHAEGVARPRRALRWRRTHLATRPPIRLEDVDEYEGIPLKPDVGHVAFDLYGYAKATGDETVKLSKQLAEDERLLPALFAAVDYHRETMTQLEAQLGMPAEELALGLYVLSLIAARLSEQRLPGFDEVFWAEVATLRTSHVGIIGVDEKLQGAIHDLFDDFFKLRKNVYDGPKIAELLRGRTPRALLESLAQVDVAQLDKDYRLDGEPLSEALSQACSLAERILTRTEGKEENLSPVGQNLLISLQANGKQGVPLNQASAEALSEVREARPDLYASLRIVAGRPSKA